MKRGILIVVLALAVGAPAASAAPKPDRFSVDGGTLVAVFGNDVRPVTRLDVTCSRARVTIGARVLLLRGRFCGRGTTPIDRLLTAALR